MKKIEVAVILGAGFGKRLSPITNKIPKPLIKIGSETILEKTIKLVKKLNLKKILINAHYKRDQLKNFIEKKNFDIEIVNSTDKEKRKKYGYRNQCCSIIVLVTWFSRY